MLLFASQENMASGQLANPFSAMSLESQVSQDGVRGRQAACRPPPAFDGSQTMSWTSQNEAPGTQDFITPVDQFATTAPQGLRPGPSPAQLSPNRMKRARRVGQGEAAGCQRATELPG